MQKILIIDDDKAFCDLIDSVAQGLNLTCTATTDPATFLASLTPEIKLIVMDLMMPEMDGIELLRLLGKRQCEAGIILVSGVGKRILEMAQELAAVLGLSIVGHLEKPFRLPDLERELKKHLAEVTAPAQERMPQIAIEDAELLRAIERDEFVLHYQPQVEIASGRIVGVEALARWQHPDRGLIYPDHFISRLEKMKLIDEFGWIVTRRGMKEIGQFADIVGNTPKLSVNVSMYSLHDLGFPDKLANLAVRSGMPLKNMVLEITESGFIQELSQTLDVLTRLRMKTVLLSIDDFGTGYSVMQHLRHIPATELKIDKSFVQNIGKHARDQVLVLKTIEIGHELGMTVVAEGVETVAQLEFLRLNRCDFAQGYLFSRPLAPRTLTEWLAHYSPQQTNGYAKVAVESQVSVK